MGFGILLFGYTFAFRTELANGLDVFPNLWGILLLLSAMFLLGRYQAQFCRARLPLYCRLVIECALLALLFCPQNAVIAIVTRVLRALSVALDAWFHYHLLVGLYAICTQVHLPRMATKARRNLTIALFYYPLALIYASALPIFGRYTPQFSLIFLLLELIWIFFNLFLIYTCYQNICLAKDNQRLELPPTHQKNQKKG